MNNTLNIPNAQEAYTSSLKQLSYLDTSDILEKAAIAIKNQISIGGLCVNIGPFTNFLQAEKAAIELQDLGYKATTFLGSPVIENGIQVPASGIQINWKYMPDNTRETYE